MCASLPRRPRPLQLLRRLPPLPRGSVSSAPSAAAAAVSPSPALLVSARPHLSFPRALRKALPLRLLQLATLLRGTQQQLAAAAQHTPGAGADADASALPDLAAATLRQIIEHDMPAVRTSQIFKTKINEKATATNSTAASLSNRR